MKTIASIARDGPSPVWRYFTSPASRQWFHGMSGGLLVAWTGLPTGLWALASGVLAGAIIGAFGGASSGIAHTLHIGPGVGFGAAVIGAFIGLVYGFLFICGLVFTHLFFLAGGIASGLVVAYVTLWLLVEYEAQLLRLRGYRALSRRENELIGPLTNEILQRMGIVGPRPIFYVSDSKEPAAWTHANSIILTQRLLGSYDNSENPPIPDMPHNAFAAVVAHEISHWARGDGVGIRAVWACCWPIVAVYNFASILGKRRQSMLGWFLFWPAWVSIKLVAIPILTKAMRQSEYEADALTASLGDEYRVGLRTALVEFQGDWEAPRTGWEDVLHATHPPIEHRLQRLESGLTGVSVSLGLPGRDDVIEYHPPDVLTWLSAPGYPDQNKLFIRDPIVLDLIVQYQHALAEQNNEQVAELARDIKIAEVAWLQRMRDALAHGQTVPINNSLSEIEQHIDLLEKDLYGSA